MIRPIRPGQPFTGQRSSASTRHGLIRMMEYREGFLPFHGSCCLLGEWDGTQTTRQGDVICEENDDGVETEGESFRPTQ